MAWTTEEIINTKSHETVVKGVKFDFVCGMNDWDYNHLQLLATSARLSITSIFAHAGTAGIPLKIRFYLGGFKCLGFVVISEP